MIVRILGTVIGLALVVIGIPLMVSPIPFGIILIALGLIILIGSNTYFAGLIKQLRRKYKPVDDALDKAEEFLPEPLAKPLHDTDNDDDEPQSALQADARRPMMKRVSFPRNLR